MNQQTSAGEDVENRERFCTLGGNENIAPVESSMEIPQKIKNGSAFPPSDPISVNISKGTQNTNLKEYICPFMFFAALFIIARIWKQLKCPSVDEWIKQLWNIYTMEYYLAIKKKTLLFATVLMDLENIMLSKISQRNTNIT